MTFFPCLVRASTPAGEHRYSLGDPLVDSYLAFVAGRARPNTLRAVAHDLKTFFTVVDKAPAEVVAADVFEFLAHQRGDRRVVRISDGGPGSESKRLAAASSAAFERATQAKTPQEAFGAVAEAVDKAGDSTLAAAYTYLQRAVGVLAVLLVPVLVVGHRLADHEWVRDSISSYYYTHMGNVFVGVLAARAVFFLSYNYRPIRTHAVRRQGTAGLGTGARGSGTDASGDCDKSDQSDSGTNGNTHVVDLQSGLVLSTRRDAGSITPAARLAAVWPGRAPRRGSRGRLERPASTDGPQRSGAWDRRAASVAASPSRPSSRKCAGAVRILAAEDRQFSSADDLMKWAERDGRADAGFWLTVDEFRKSARETAEEVPRCVPTKPRTAPGPPVGRQGRPPRRGAAPAGSPADPQSLHLDSGYRVSLALYGKLSPAESASVTDATRTESARRSGMSPARERLRQVASRQVRRRSGATVPGLSCANFLAVSAALQPGSLGAAGSLLHHE